jgi:hypothetical protein
VLKAWPPLNNVQVLMTSRLGKWRRDIASIDVAAWALDEAVRYLPQESGPAMNRTGFAGGRFV